jgi:NTE family protein
MKLISYSGGSTKGIAHIAIWERLQEKGWIPDVSIGVSIGAVLQVLLFLGKGDKAREIFLNLKLKDFWSITPVNEKGKFTFRGFWNVVLGKRYLGATGKLRDLIKYFVSREDFIRFKASGKQAYVVCVDIDTGELLNLRVNTLTYEEYIDYTLASASIPVFTPGVLDEWSLYYDGGLRVHNPAHLLLETMKFDEAISIYLRPESMENVLGDKSPRKILPVLMRTIDIMNYEISKRDALLEKLYMPNVKQIFTPKVLTSLYDTNNTRMLELYTESRKLV